MQWRRPGRSRSTWTAIMRRTHDRCDFSVPEMERAGRKPARTSEASDGIAVSRTAFGGCPDRGGIPRRLRGAAKAWRAGDDVPIQSFGEAESQEGGQEAGCADTGA